MPSTAAKLITGIRCKSAMVETIFAFGLEGTPTIALTRSLVDASYRLAEVSAETVVPHVCKVLGS